MMDIYFDLCIFGEGGAGAEGSGDAGATSSVTPDGATESPEGKTDDAERRANFEEILKQNKDLYEEKLKGQLDRRMRSAQKDIEALNGQKAQYENLAQALANRYGVDPSNLEGIVKAVDEDSSWLEEQAARNGLTVEQQRHINALEAENSRYKAVKEAAERQQRADEALGKWRAEEEQLKTLYPDFDLETEVQNNQQFAELLRNHVPMQTAYQVVHMDEIMTSGMQYATQKASDSIAASVRANGLRPQEGAGRSNAPTKVSIDPSKLTKQQRDELNKRAARGEIITFT